MAVKDNLWIGFFLFDRGVLWEAFSSFTWNKLHLVSNPFTRHSLVTGLVLEQSLAFKAATINGRA